jgi:putative toxin-antitoxin system antitoxin component (TIGR02293 family)
MSIKASRPKLKSGTIAGAFKGADHVIGLAGSRADVQAGTCKLLGGRRVIGAADPADPFSAHQIIAGGLPNRAVNHLNSSLMVMGREAFERAIGVSARTLQRWEKQPSEKLSQEQGGRVWKFAELLTRATAVLGSQADAEKWFERPAVGLNQRRPIELLSTPAGVELVEEYLDRLAYGIYT